MLSCNTSNMWYSCLYAFKTYRFVFCLDTKKKQLKKYVYIIKYFDSLNDTGI